MRELILECLRAFANGDDEQCVFYLLYIENEYNIAWDIINKYREQLISVTGTCCEEITRLENIIKRNNMEV